MSGLDLLSPSKGDFVDPCLGYLVLILKFPNWLKRLLSFLLKPVVRTQWWQGLEGRRETLEFSPSGEASLQPLQPLPRLLSSPQPTCHRDTELLPGREAPGLA